MSATDVSGAALQGRSLVPGSLERRLIDAYQDGVPLDPRPYAVMAERLGETEEAVIAALDRLATLGVLSRIGPVLAPNRVGVSTLAAMAVPPARLSEVAALVSGYDEVNHNYEREHAYSLWFVATAPDRRRLDAVLGDIAERSGIAVVDLPLEAEYHIDLGFPVEWN